MPKPYNASHKQVHPPRSQHQTAATFVDPAIVQFSAQAPAPVAAHVALPHGIVPVAGVTQQRAQQVPAVVYPRSYQQQQQPYYQPQQPHQQHYQYQQQQQQPSYHYQQQQQYVAVVPSVASVVTPIVSHGLMCTGCQQRFPDADTLASHMEAKNHGHWHECRVQGCSWSFVTAALLQEHVTSTHGRQQRPSVQSHQQFQQPQPAQGALQAVPSYAHAAVQPAQPRSAQHHNAAAPFNTARYQQQQAAQPAVASSQQGPRKSQLTEGNSLNRDSKKTYDAIVKAFIENDNEGELQFPPTLTAEERHHVHKLCMHYSLEHASTGAGASRQLKIWKPHFVPKAVDGESIPDALVGKSFNGFTGVQPLNDEYLEDHLQEVSQLVEGRCQEMQDTLMKRLAHDAAVARKPRPSTTGTWFSGAHPGKSDKPAEHTAQLQQFRQRLPSYTMKDQVIEAVRSNRVTVVSGDTGCGKTTQLPQLLYDAGLGKEICPDVKDGGMIICTQPRRVSAISVSQRVAEERGERCGGVVGYSIRFENVASAATRVLYMTTGILLRRLHSDPELKGVAVVILDEVHERDVDTDFALLLLRDLVRAKGSKIRLVVMSATIQVDKLVSYFTMPRPAHPPPLITIPGTMFPVKEYWLDDAMQWLNLSPEAVPAMSAAIEAAKRRVAGPTAAEQSSSYDALKSAALENLDKVQVETIVPVDVICGIIEAYHRDQPRTNAILVFLPGWAAIDKIMNILRARPGNLARELSILPLHSTLTTAEQQRVFHPAPKNFRKVVLSTNIAETSVTIDDIVLVIDSGLHKGSSYDPAGNTSSLTSQLIAKANGHQRRGRAGRVRPGVCVHLLPRATYDALPAFLLPEMQRTALEEICLQVKAIVDNEYCLTVLSKALDPPPANSIKHAVAQLTAMGALDSKERLTALGRVLATIPMHPALGKMLLLGASLGVFDPLCTLAAALSAKSPFVRPMPHQLLDAKAAQQKFEGNKQSDHLAMLELFTQWSRANRRSDFAFSNWADHTVLNGMERMRQQLRKLLDQSGYLKKSPKPGWENRYRTNEALIRFALAHSLTPRIAVYERDYRGRQDNIFCWDNKPCTFHLGSALARTKLRFVQGREFFVYYDRMRIESQLQLFDATCLSRTLFLLSAKTLTSTATRDIPEDLRLDPLSKFCAWDHVSSDIETTLPVTLEIDGGQKRFAVTENTAAVLLAVHDTVNFFFALAMQRMDVAAVPDSVVRALAAAIGQPAAEVAAPGPNDDAPVAAVRLGPAPSALVPHARIDSESDDDRDHAPELGSDEDDTTDGSPDSLRANLQAPRQLAQSEVDILVRAFGDLSWITRRAMPSAEESAPATAEAAPLANDAAAVEAVAGMGDASRVEWNGATAVGVAARSAPNDDDDDEDDGDEVVKTTTTTTTTTTLGTAPGRW